MAPGDQTGHTRIGVILAAHGIKGEVKVLPSTESPEYYSENLPLCRIIKSSGISEHEAESIRLVPGKSFIIIKLAGIDDRTEAETLKNCDLLVPDSQLSPVSEDEYYVHQLIGCLVMDEDGEELGQISGYFDNGAHGILEMDTPEGIVLVPYTNEVIVGVSPEERKIIISPLPGMMELNRP